MGVVFIKIATTVDKNLSDVTQAEMLTDNVFKLFILLVMFVDFLPHTNRCKNEMKHTLISQGLNHWLYK